MKKILFVVLLAMLSVSMTFADITAVDGTNISVTTLQTGGIYLRTPTDEVYFNPEQRDKFIEVLRVQAEILTAIASEKITIKDSRFVGTYTLSITSSVDFWVYINNYKPDSTTILEIGIKSSRARIVLDLDRLNALIKELESTKAVTESNLTQKARIDELIKKAELAIRS